MFLFERLVGVGVYAAVLVLVCLMLSGNNNSGMRRVVLFFYTVALAAMGFFYVPYETADLYRLYEYVEAYSKYSFSGFIQQQNLTGGISLPNLYYWAIGQTGVRELLPAITAFVCYSCIFYIFNKTADKNKISGKNAAIALFFYMSIGNYMFVISGIRCMLGISLFSFCFFRESVEKKFNLLHIPLYVIAALIHTFAAVLIAARFFLPIVDAKTTALKRMIYLFVLAIGSVFALRYFSGYIETILGKAESYLGGGMYSYFWEYLIGAIVFLVFAATLVKQKKLNAEGNLKLNVFRLYAICGLIGALLLCFEFSIFHRTLTYILPIICLPILMTVLQKSEELAPVREKRIGETALEKPINFRMAILAVSVLLLLLACSRGTLCSLKFFVL